MQVVNKGQVWFDGNLKLGYSKPMRYKHQVGAADMRLFAVFCFCDI